MCLPVKNKNKSNKEKIYIIQKYIYWKNKYPRYYYIFDLNEIINLFTKAGLILIEKKYDCGNEIFLLKKSI